MRTLNEIMTSELNLSHPILLDGDFDDMLPEESLFYTDCMADEEMEAA